MSEKLYERFTGVFLGIAVLFMASFTSTVIVLIVFLMAANYLLYTVLGSLLGCGVAVTWYLFYVRTFTRDINLYVPVQNSKGEKLKPLDVHVEGLPLNVCLLYNQGFSMSEIQRKYNIKHPNTVRRQLQKGIEILIKNYEATKHEPRSIELKQGEIP